MVKTQGTAELEPGGLLRPPPPSIHPTNLPWTMVKLASGLRAISPAGKGCYTNTHVKG